MISQINEINKLILRSVIPNNDVQAEVTEILCEIISNPENINIFLQLSLQPPDNQLLIQSYSLYLHKMINLHWEKYSMDVKRTILENLIHLLLCASDLVQIQNLTSSILFIVQYSRFVDFPYYSFLNSDLSTFSPFQIIQTCHVLSIISPPEEVIPKILAVIQQLFSQPTIPPYEAYLSFSLLIRIDQPMLAASIYPNIFEILKNPNLLNDSSFSILWQLCFHSLSSIIPPDSFPQVFSDLLILAFQLASNQETQLQRRFFILDAIIETPIAFLEIEQLITCLDIYFQVLISCAQIEPYFLYNMDILPHVPTFLLNQIHSYALSHSSEEIHEDCGLEKVQVFFQQLMAEQTFEALLIALNLIPIISNTYTSEFSNNFDFFYQLISGTFSLADENPDITILCFNIIQECDQNVSNLLLHSFFPIIIELCFHQNEEIQENAYQALNYLEVNANIPNPSLLPYFLENSQKFLARNVVQALDCFSIVLKKMDSNFISQEQLSDCVSLYGSILQSIQSAENSEDIICHSFLPFSLLLKLSSNPNEIFISANIFNSIFIENNIDNMELLQFFFDSMSYTIKSLKMISFSLYEPIFQQIYPFLMSYASNHECDTIFLIAEYWPIESFSFDSTELMALTVQKLQNHLETRQPPFYLHSLVKKINPTLFYQFSQQLSQIIISKDPITLDCAVNDYRLTLKKIRISLNEAAEAQIYTEIYQALYNMGIGILQSFFKNQALLNQYQLYIILLFEELICFKDSRNIPFLKFFRIIFPTSSIEMQSDILFVLSKGAFHQNIPEDLVKSFYSLIFGENPIENLINYHPSLRGKIMDFFLATNFIPENSELQHTLIELALSWLNEINEKDNYEGLYDGDSISQWILMNLISLPTFELELFEKVLERFPPVSKSTIPHFCRLLLQAITEGSKVISMNTCKELIAAIRRLKNLPENKKYLVPNDLLEFLYSFLPKE